jgi:hypothetical protein
LKPPRSGKETEPGVKKEEKRISDLRFEIAKKGREPGVRESEGREEDFRLQTQI